MCVREHVCEPHGEGGREREREIRKVSVGGWVYEYDAPIPQPETLLE